MEKIQFSERDGGSKVKFATCISIYPQLHYQLTLHHQLSESIYHDNQTLIKLSKS